MLGRISLLLSAFLVGVALAVLLAFCGPLPGVNAPSVDEQPTPASSASPSDLSTAPPPPRILPPFFPENAIRTGFRFPIAGACLSSTDNHMPNAPRAYRAGVHEGVDFYDGYACAPAGRGVAVAAARDGVVRRADHGYRELTPVEMEAVLTRSQRQGYTGVEDLDRLRGRQVWIDHGAGIVTRYAHLLDIPSAIREGVSVKAGQVIGYVGNSGILEGLTDPDAENHLHFEVRIGDRYLGQGAGPAEVRGLYEQVFGGR